MKPEPLPRWRIYILGFIIASFLVGLGCAFAGTYYRPAADFTAIFYVSAAAFGATQAASKLRMHFWVKEFAEENAHMPVSIAMDGKSGYATVTRLDGQLASVHVPDEVLEQGPEAVMDFVVDALEP